MTFNPDPVMLCACGHEHGLYDECDHVGCPCKCWLKPEPRVSILGRVWKWITEFPKEWGK